jgi:NADH-quinone oxidoreductase subunit L
VGLSVGTVLALSGIAVAYYIWVRHPEIATRMRERFGALYELLHHKWYFDEAIDALIVRPAALAGSFARQSFERLVIEGVIVGGAQSLAGASSALVRALQSGLLRAYATLLALGAAAVTLYFLLKV